MNYVSEDNTSSTTHIDSQRLGESLMCLTLEFATINDWSCQKDMVYPSENNSKWQQPTFIYNFLLH